MAIDKRSSVDCLVNKVDHSIRVNGVNYCTLYDGSCMFKSYQLSVLGEIVEDNGFRRKELLYLCSLKYDND